MLKISFISLLFISSFVNAEETRLANAHVHGLNNLSMVISQNQIAITYEMPIIQMFDEHDEHDEHEEESHNEFYAKYSFSCGNIQEIDRIEFTYFKTFANSSELEVQFISNVGSTSFEVEGDAPFILTEGKI